MQKLVNILFAARLAATLSVAGLLLGEFSSLAGEAEIEQSGGMARASADVNAPLDPESLPPSAVAFVYYFRIQAALSQDSLTNVAANARALAAALRTDSTGAFPAQLVAQASALARDAVTLSGARLDFAIISGQLINYLKKNDPPLGLVPIHQFYDPETKLYWLQTGDIGQNPYLGKTGVRRKSQLP